MKSKMFCVYDSKVEAYNVPFFARTEAEAIRMFSNECNNPQSQLHLHSEDYSLFFIAEYTDHDAVIIPVKVVCIAKAHELKKQQIMNFSFEEKHAAAVKAAQENSFSVSDFVRGGKNVDLKNS